MVSRMRVPEGHALMGIAPALTIIFGTDNTDDITQGIYGLSRQDAVNLSDKIQNTVASEEYPLTGSMAVQRPRS